MSTATHARDRRTDHLRALRDHPSTSPEERAAATEALRRIGIESERPWDKPDLSPWGKPTSPDDLDRAERRAAMDARILDIKMQIVTANIALHDARIAEQRATTLRRISEGELAELQQQLASQQVWRKAMG